MLMVVPIEVGIADRLRRIPIFLVLGFFGASGMIAADLWSDYERINFLKNLGIASIVAVVALMLQIIVMFFLLWKYRLRTGSPYYTRLDLVTQQSLIFAMIFVLSIILVTGVLITQIRSNQIEQVGENFQNVAEIYGERIGNLLDQQVNNLSSLSRLEPILIDGLTEANARYPEDRTAVEQIIADNQLQWERAPDTSDFVLAVRNNEATFALSRFRGNALAHQNVFLTDRYGALVAAQGKRPEKYYYGDEIWWQTAWNYGQGGIYAGDLTIDPETGIASIFIAVGMINPQTNETAGVLASTFLLRNLQREPQIVRENSAENLLLIAKDGMIIAAPNNDDIGKNVRDTIQNRVPLREGLFEPDWYLGEDYVGNPAVLGFAPLTNTERVRLEVPRSLGWVIVVSDTQSNALAEVTRSIKVASLVGLIVSGLGILAAIFLASFITRPIEGLTTTATAIAAGDLNQQANPAGPRELQTLAEAFNTLTAQLRSLINNLQDQVTQRTAQLESRVEQLATLNRITQTISSIHSSDRTLHTVAREMVTLFDAHDSAIALLDTSDNVLRIVANYSWDKTLPDTVGEVISLQNNPLLSQVIRVNRAEVIPDAQTSPKTEGIHDLLKRLNTRCLMLVPLLSRGEVTGTISIATDQEDRIFTEAEVSLAETVAGQITGAIESARLYTQAQEARTAAEAANESKSAFLASVSHELRTPLTSVLGFAKIIQKRLDERIFPIIQTDDRRIHRTMQQITDNVKIIVEEGERLTALINNVLDLAKIEAGKIEWNMQILNIADVVERATAATIGLFEHKTLRQVMDIQSQLPQIYGDHDKLIQVVVNLISNAVKFTAEGSVTCQVRQRGNEIVVSIIDTGVGIAPEDQESVFEKFKQVGDTLTDKPQGTGLGLSICKEIVEHHGGRLRVESSPGKGSTFSFTLPVLNNPDQKISSIHLSREILLNQLENQYIAPPLSPNEEEMLRRKHILFVDDDAAIRELYRQELKSYHCTVIPAPNVKIAMEEIQKEAPNLVILDLILPEGSGLDVVREIRGNPRTMGVPVVMLTISEDRELGMRFGADRYIVKPADTETVLKAVNQLMKPGFSAKEVYIADDDEDTCTIVGDYLKKAGHQSQAFSDKETLLAEIRKHKPDMLIIDDRLVNGMMEALQADETLSHLYMVVYS
ncbi:MAG TPA: ATP-binding protein, partial [Aggregatilineales bacterium]|nr:ATP-binding protein [Aggregatilineales bacterium]